jgi:hypothetical protein
LRYSPAIVELVTKKPAGEILGCDTFGPCSLEEHHPDLYWYGVHGVEMLFTLMGTGCKSVKRVQTDNYEHVVGVWEDGRVGTFRGLKSGKSGYGFTVYGTKAVVQGGKFGGYDPLVKDVIKFFKTGAVPVPPEETIEIFAFMSAADESKAKGGATVSIKDTIEKAEKQNRLRQRRGSRR